MGSSESKETVVIDNSDNEIEIITPGQLQYTFIRVKPQENCCLFSVKAAQDAYIALSSYKFDPEYEILIGTSDNRHVVIKSRKKELVKASVPNILHKNETRSFWLEWKDNKLLLGRKDEPQALVYYSNFKRVPINYIGICTNGSTGAWTIKKKCEIESSKEKCTRNEPATPTTTSASGYSSKYSYSFAGSSSKFTTGPSPQSKTKIEDDNVFPNLTSKKSNIGAENTAKINNNFANIEKTDKTNPVNYVDNLKNFKINKNNCYEGQGSTRNLGTDNKTKTEYVDTSKGGRKHHHRDKKNDHRRSKSSSTNNNFKTQNECENIISFNTLLEIGKKSPHHILFELQSYKFERLFEIKLKKSYINIILDILAKLCKADFLGNKRSVIIGFFSKEVFRKELLNYMYEMRLETDENYKKHLRHINNMWKSLYIVCQTAANIPAELQSGYLENLTLESINTLKAMMCRDDSRKTKLEKFIKLKEYIDIETKNVH